MVGTPDPARPLVGGCCPGFRIELVLPPFLVDSPETRQYRRQYYADVLRADADFGAIYDLFLETCGAANPVLFHERSRRPMAGREVDPL
jgi:hypothetical protein